MPFSCNFGSLTPINHNGTVCCLEFTMENAQLLNELARAKLAGLLECLPQENGMHVSAADDLFRKRLLQC